MIWKIGLSTMKKVRRSGTSRNALTGTTYFIRKAICSCAMTA